MQQPSAAPRSARRFFDGVQVPTHLPAIPSEAMRIFGVGFEIISAFSTSFDSRCIVCAMAYP
jgi:hypothetical protein